MPVFEFDETMGKREIGGRTLLDYWGYNTVGFFAPNTGYTARQEYNREGTEFKKSHPGASPERNRSHFRRGVQSYRGGNEQGTVFLNLRESTTGFIIC